MATSTRARPSWLVGLIVLASCGAMVGCGSSAAPAPAPPAEAAKPAESGEEKKGDAPAATPAPAPNSNPTAAAVDTAGSGFGETAGSGDGETSGTEQPYEVATTEEEVIPRYAVVEQAGKRNVDVFAMTPIGAGADSSLFVIDGQKQKPAPVPENVLPVPPGFQALPEFGYSPQGLPWKLMSRDQAVMVLVPEGTFVQGVEGAAPPLGPAHTVYLDSFYIDEKEVTVEQYEAYREFRREEKKRVQAPAREASDPAEPVLGINWGEANLYAHWVGKTLPTEAQWEKAARGPNTFMYPWGNDAELWETPRVPGQIDLVGSFQGDRSPYGAMDMAGNAREWCADWFLPDYYRTLAAEGEVRNPAGPRGTTAGQQRAVRGSVTGWNITDRAGVDLTERPTDVGFRCVLNVLMPREEPAKTPPEETPAARPGTKTKKPAPKTSPKTPASKR